MIRIVLSNRTERLLAALAGDLKRFRAERGPWETPELVLPNAGMRDYVLRGLARTDLKVSANLQSNYLDGFWRRFLPGGERPLRLLDRMTLQGVLLGLLQDPVLLEEPVLAPVRAYLSGGPRAVKAMQLAEALARVFEAYSLGRPEWLAAWQTGAAVDCPGPEAMVAWQGRLWAAVRARLAPLPEEWLTLAEFFRGPGFARARFPGEVFCFGLGPFAQAYHDAFWRLGRQCQVNLYVATPCREIWDDLRQDWDRNAAEEDPFGTDTRAHLALQRWGKPGREQVCQLCQLTDWDVDMDVEEAGGASLLQRLQDEILTLGTGEPRALPPEPDGSIRILACPSPRREAEAVANAIWQTLIDHPGLRFSDIAVLLPEGAKEDYLDPLRVAFAETRQIPWRLADQGPNLVRELADAAIQLLQLGLSDLNRAQVLRVLGHPALRRRWPGLALEDLAEFCERAGIVARMEAPEAEPSYLEHGLWTWSRGFRRSALGFFTGAAATLAEAGDLLPAALALPGSPDLALFLQAMLADLERLKAARQGPRAWAAQFREFLQAYLGQPEARAGEAEARAMNGLGKALERLEALEVPGLAAPELGCREAVAAAAACFQRLLDEALNQSGRGVAVAAHGALRGLPFRAMFLMGLGEGGFPQADSRDPLDLRPFRRRAGDVKRSEQDRYLFLEALTCARERLVLSYVARDAVTGEELQPSPLILDLRDILLPALGPEGWAALQVRHRIQRDDPAYFPELAPGGRALAANHNPAAREEAEALWIGQGLRRAAGAVTELPGGMEQWGLDPAAGAALAARVHSCGPLAGAEGEPAGPLRVSAGALRKWLECQIQGGALLRLGLRAEDEYDPAERAEEPFATAFLDRWSVLRGALWEALASGRPATAVLRERLARMREEAKAPAGFLGAGERAAAARQLTGWEGLMPPGAAPVLYRFGAERGRIRPALPVQAWAPLELDLDLGGAPVRCQLEGLTEPQGDGATLMLSERPLAALGKPPTLKDRCALLRAWFDQLLLAAAGIREGGHRARVFAWYQGASQVREVQLPPVTRDEARARLGAWIEEAFGRPRWTLMPIEAVLDLWSQEGQAGPAALAEWIEQAGDGGFSSLYGPLPRALGAPLEADWRGLAAARLGTFPDWSARWESAP